MKPEIEKINDYIKARDLQATAIRASTEISKFLEQAVNDLPTDEFNLLIKVRDFLSRYTWGQQVNEKWNAFMQSLNNEQES